jgi:methionyl-tRNA synthetase
MRFYVTTPIYYVNATPTLGHAYTTIAADILARHHRQRGDETYFLTGVDEHADKVARVAAEQGLGPKEYADRIVGVWQDLPRRLKATIDFFIRTSDGGHKRFVQGFFSGSMTTATCTRTSTRAGTASAAREPKTEAELVDGKCAIHGTAPEWLEEKNWFFVSPRTRTSSPSCTTSVPTSCCRTSATTRRAASSPAGSRLLDQPRHADGAFRSPGILSRSRTSGPMRSSTTAALSYAPGENLERFWPFYFKRISFASTASTGGAAPLCG